MNLVIVLVLLVVGSLLFHWWSPWWFTPLASNWSTVDFTVDVTLVITAIVFASPSMPRKECDYVIVGTYYYSYYW